MTAEEIFNMFFGGGFPSQTVYMRGGQNGGAAFRRQAHFQRHFGNAGHRERGDDVSLCDQLKPGVTSSLYSYYRMATRL